MAQFYPLKVVDIIRETEDCVSLVLEPTDGGDFSFIAGQYLTLKTKIKGEEVRRSYSLSTSPKEGVLRVAVKEVSGGLFSTFANRELKAGDVIESLPPDGRFKVDEASVNHLGFAAGSGITPVLSQIKHILETNENSKFALFYVNKETASIIYRDEIAELKDVYLDRFQLFHLLTREPIDAELFAGRLDKERCSRIFNNIIDPSSYDVAYICGPEAMIMDCKDALVEAGMPASQVKFELFTSSTKAAGYSDVATENSDSDEVDVHIVLDGVTTKVKVKKKDKSILDAALDAGLDAPFSCQGGVCCVCRCKMDKGTASMDINYALEEDEVENGFILSCQARPTGDGPWVADFDQQ
ncbi:MAG: phenylacetic acid degradation protein [Crocinitomicaceae bacterium]|nr:phenylacetic acid degradation protein [Crocinitomicaceae bacterium]|tara:strand:- start:11194 stop:12255 length:1062 start_codon:yes stop_codon:yes gene_type:complete